MMKRLNLSILLVIVFCFFGCESFSPFDPNDPGGGDEPSGSHETLAYYIPGENPSLGTQKGLIKIIVDNGSADFISLSSLYPPSSLYKNCAINGGRVALGLHKDFNQGSSARGASFAKGDTEAYYLPLLEPEQDDDYTTFDATSVKVSANGYVFYISANNDQSYHDQYWPTLVRYNPSDNVLVHTINTRGFTLAQPEKGSDTEQGITNRYFCVSPDGRYAYGKIEAMGVDGGAVHWDYTIIFRYDFETNEYTRVGEGDRSVNLYGLTSDGQYLLYSNYDGSKNHFKIYNTSSGTVETREYYNTDTRLNAASWNQKGFVTGGDGSTTTRLAYHNIVDNEYVVIADFSQNRPRNSQFSPDGDFVYFCFYGETENYFCKTADLSAGSEIDTLYSYSKEIVDWLVVK